MLDEGSEVVFDIVDGAKVLQQCPHVGMELLPVYLAFDSLHVVELADLPSVNPGMGVADHGEGLVGIDHRLQADPGVDALFVRGLEEHEALADRRGVGLPALATLHSLTLA